MKRAIFGFGGHAREILSIVQNIDKVFVDDKYVTNETLPISQFNPEEHEIMVCVSDPKDRNEIVKKLPANTKYFSFIHPTALIFSDIEIGEGSYVGPYSILTENIVIGSHALLNRMNQIGHDCEIGDFISMMPGSIISGTCILGDRVYIGSNSSVKEKISICDDVTIGLVSGVVKNVTESGVYGGVPVSKIK
jgi:sugar O-acyltransferase (sialic acid O-acetyltransferase NeuD family)